MASYNRSSMRRGFAAGMCLVSLTGTAHADDLWQALTGGKPDVYLRYRFEHVDDDALSGSDTAPTGVADAYASTLRTALGYNTGLFHGFGAYVQLEDVRVVGNDSYNDGGSNGVTHRAIVVDPGGTEVNQANLRYRGLPKTTIWVGRQEIEQRGAPLHRYVGNILWRQNWQSFDAVRVVSDYLPATKIDYTYAWNTNRIFGEENEIPDRANYRMDSHFIKVNWSGFQYGQFEPYAYLLDFDTYLGGTEVLSTATFGVRFQGAYDLITQAAKILYTGEFANQTDYADNPFDVDNNYYLGELGFNKMLTSPTIPAFTVKISYEVLEGEGPAVPGVPNAFQTPLGTNHAFQGWADRFLLTPGDGIVDIYGTLAATVYGANFMLMYHDLSSDNEDYDYGTELDVVLSRTFKDHYTVGLKYADYDADQNATNLGRNGLLSGGKQAFDLTKFWAWVEIKF